MSDAATASEQTARETGPVGSGWSPQRILSQLRERPLLPLLVAGAAVIAVIAALLMWATAPEYRVLYGNLADADGGRIINELEQRGVPYRLREGGRALLVPGDQVHALRLQLAEQGLPQAGNVGFEIMDEQAFGISQFAERINYQRGLQGELASSIEALGPVAQARVHLALAKPSAFVRDRKPAKASVILTLHPGRVLGEGQVDAVGHMVSSSVPRLATEDVTVVDQDGRLLSRRQGPGLDGTQLDYIETVERSYRRRIENILVPILGRDNVRAQVTAQIDFTRREETSEEYAPNQNGNPASVRSAQVSTSYNGGDGPAQGVPGALSNTPPGAAPSPVEAPETAAGTADTEEGGDAPGRFRKDNTTNYEVDRNIIHIRHPRARIKRLSVAVVVDHRETTDDQGATVRVPLDEEQLDRVSRLVRQAMGYSWSRGDELEVINSPFAERDDQAEPGWWQASDWPRLAATLGRYLLVLAAIVLLYLWVLRPLIRRYEQAPAAAPRPAAAAPGDAADEETEAEAAPRRRRQRPSPGYQQNLQDLQDMAREDPGMVAMIVRSWMNRNE